MSNSFLITYTITLFALLNAIGMVPFFIAYTAMERRGVQMWVAAFVSITVFALMLIVLALGEPALAFLGISLDAFRIAGGILLLLIGISMTNGNTGVGTQEVDKDALASDIGQAKSVYRKIVVPMAIPLLVGPGEIAYIILHASIARTSHQALQYAEMVLGIAVVSVLCFVILWGSRSVQRVLGSIGLTIMTRIMGLLVAAIGVQFMVTGAIAVLHVALNPATPAAP